MALHIYMGDYPQHAHEKDSIQSLVDKLKAFYDNEDSFCYLYINYQCGNRQIDASLIRENAIINLEIKSLSVHRVVITNQGDLLFEPSQRRLSEDRENPFNQVKEQTYALQNFINKYRDTLFNISESMPKLDICGFIVLNHYEELDLSSFDKRLTAFYRITDHKRAIEDLLRYKGRDPYYNEKVLHLDEEMPKKMAKLLQLREIPDASRLFTEEKPAGSLDLQDYLKGCLDDWQVKNYVHRPQYESVLMDNQRTVLIGSPGSGKTSLQKIVLRNHARHLIEKNDSIPIPCLLQMKGYENIPEQISGNLGITDIELVQQRLHDGELWIAFDGVDEIVHFKENFPKICSFIKLYPKNKYSLSIRKEFIEIAGCQEWITALHCAEVVVDQLNEDEKTKLIRYYFGENQVSKPLAEFQEFLSTIPDSNPLTVLMAIEVFLNADKPVYESRGKFYEQFMELKLKKEVRRAVDLMDGGEYLLEKILTELAVNTIIDSYRVYDYQTVLATISNITHSEPTYYLNLLINAELLSKYNRKARLGGRTGKNGEKEILRDAFIDSRDTREVKPEKGIEFAHGSYREFYAALGLLQRNISVEELISTVKEAKETGPFKYYVGIEPSRAKAEAVIQHLELPMAVSCLCETHNVSAQTITAITRRLIESIKEGFGMNVLNEVESYGERICGAELIYALDNGLTDIFDKIRWEYIKENKLQLGSAPNEYSKTPYYLSLKGQTKNWKIDDTKHPARTKNTVDENPIVVKQGEITTTCFSRLAENRFGQTIAGWRLYTALMAAETVEEILRLTFCGIDDEVRTSAIGDIIQFIQRGIIDQKQALSYIQIVPAEFISRTYSFRWEVLAFLLLDLEQAGDPPCKQDINLASNVINVFWAERDPSIQFRIVYQGKFPESLHNEFFKMVLDRYLCTETVDVWTFRGWYGEYFEPEQWDLFGFEGEPAIAGEYSLEHFSEGAYSDLIKCVALQRLIDNNAVSKAYLEKISMSVEPKLKYLANKLLSEE